MLPLLLQEVNKLYSELITDSNAESFDSAYFSGIVFSAETYFKNLPERSSTMLAINLGENIINYFHQQSQKATIASAINVLPITEEENDALQYLSGYVVKILLKKTKQRANYHSSENQAIITILQHTIVEDSSGQKLISVQNRDGLTAVTEDCQKIFYRAEEEFRIQTSVDVLREINIKMMVDHLLESIDVVSFFNAAVNMAGVDLHEEIKMNLLQNMLLFCLRVRSFSLAKDITSKKKSSNTSSKALRQDIKKSLDE